MTPAVKKPVVLAAVAAFVVLVILGTGVWLQRKQSGIVRGDRRIVFVSRRDFPKTTTNDESAIYVMNSDGTGQERLTDAAAAHYDPSWSVSGRKIAFVQKEDIFSMDDRGYDRLKLAVRGSFPRWSPDGKRIIFARQTTAQDFHLFIMNSDGSGKRLLVKGHVTQFRWSPDGRSIVFTQGRSGPSSKASIHLVDPDTGTDTPLPLPEGGDANSPCWSPDGKKIVFSAFVSEQRGDIHVFDVAANRIDKLEIPDELGIWRWQPEWSADGKRIAFLSSVDPPWRQKKEPVNVAVVEAGGSGAKLLTHYKDWQYASDIVWASDKVMFVLGEVKEKNGKKEASTNIYLAGLDGKTKRLTSSGKDFAPDWAPR